MDCYFRLELEIINLREALVILPFMKPSCLSTAVQWWQNAQMLLVAVQCLDICVHSSLYFAYLSVDLRCGRHVRVLLEKNFC